MDIKIKKKLNKSEYRNALALYNNSAAQEDIFISPPSADAPADMYILAYVGDTLAGYFLVDLFEPYAEVRAMVDPAFRGQGIFYAMKSVLESELDDEYINVTDTKSPAPKNLPGEVELRVGVSYDEAENIFDESAKLREAADKDYVSPNGDMYNRNAAQKVHTGMGIDVDELLLKMQVRPDVYTVPANTKVKEPVIIRYDLNDGDGNLTSQIIHAGKNSEVTVIYDYRSEKTSGGFHGVSTKLLAEEGATINLIKIQMLGNKFIHIDDIGGVCMEGATINDVQLELGSYKSWNGVYINLLGDESVFDGNAGYLRRDEQD